MPHCWMDLRAQFKDNLKIKVKKGYGMLVQFAKKTKQNKKDCRYSKGSLIVFMAPMCLFVCLKMLGHAPNELADGILGDH